MYQVLGLRVGGGYKVERVSEISVGADVRIGPFAALWLLGVQLGNGYGT
jgi:hypothetical protein